MYPANPFVEDFVGADRALKRLALQRVRDVDLWKAPLVRVGESVEAVRAKVRDSDLEFPLLIDEDGRPLGWLSERALAGERVTHDLRSGPEPMLDVDDVLRDALADLLQHAASTGRRRRPGRGRRRPVDRHARLACAPTPPTCRTAPTRSRRDPARPGRDPRALGRQVRVGQRLLPRLDRRQPGPLRRPVLEHVYLTLVVGRDRLRDRVRAGAARPPPALAGPADHADHRRSSTRCRASRSSSCCCR